MLVRKLPPHSTKKDYIFNMFGSAANSAVSVILLMVVSHISGDKNAGLFSLAYSTAQMMYTIGVFEMRNIQVTDAKGQFSFYDVFMYRIFTIGLMMAFTFAFVAFKGYSGTKALLIILITVYMALLTLSDVFQGVLHINGYLYLASFSLGTIPIFSSILFSLTLLLTKNILISVIPMIAFATLWIIFYDLPFVKNFVKIKPKFDFKILKAIFFCSLPLFLSTFLQQYIFNSQKYAIDDFLTSVDQSHYGYLVMPAFFINLLSIFVFRPQLVSLSENWLNKAYKKFNKTVFALYLWIAAVMVAALITAYFLGIPVLQILYGTNLSGKTNLLLILLIAGTFSAFCSLTSTFLTVIRKQNIGFFSYVFVFVLSLFLPKILIKKYELLGACVSYLIEMATLFIILLAIFLCFTVTKENKKEDDTNV